MPYLTWYLFFRWSTSRDVSTQIYIKNVKKRNFEEEILDKALTFSYRVHADPRNLTDIAETDALAQ